MTTDVAKTGELERRHWRKSIPDAHRGSLDTRILWLFNQRWGTVQMISNSSPDVLDQTACTIFFQAILGKDLNSIALIFKRLEGGALMDEEVLERGDGIRV